MNGRGDRNLVHFLIENNEIATVIQLGYNISIAGKNGWILQVVNNDTKSWKFKLKHKVRENMSEKGYLPPYTITDKTVNLIFAIT